MPIMIWAKLWFHDAKLMQTFTIDIQQKKVKISLNNGIVSTFYSTY